jgi:hypothetical protein
MRIHQLILLLIVLLLLAGCSAKAPVPTATLPPPPPPNNPGQPGQPPKPPLPPPAPTATVRTAQTGGAFSLLSSVMVTGDDSFPDGSGGYIHYVPASDTLAVIMTTYLKKAYTLPDGEVCERRAIGYKEYTTDMQPTGKEGYIACGWADSTSLLVENNLYVVSMAGGPTSPGQAPWVGWKLMKFDAVTWKKLASAEVRLDYPTEQDGGPTLSYVNGDIVSTGEYRTEALGSGSHNHLFTPDLKAVGKVTLKPPEFPVHYCEVSILQEENGDILMFASTGPKGDLMVLRLGKDWKLKEQKTLVRNAYFATGAATDGRYVYVAYTDTSTTEAGMPMEGQNVRLAAFDSDWNIVQDTAVSDVQKTQDTSDYGESPWIAMHGKYLYVSYLISRLDPATHALIDNQAYVNVYELIP